MNITNSTVDGVVIFHLAGHLDSTTSATLQEILLPAIAAGAHHVALDFVGVDYVSSAGLRTVVLAARQVRAAGGGIALCALSNPLRETFEISGFSGFIPMVGTVEEAVSAALSA